MPIDDPEKPIQAALIGITGFGSKHLEQLLRLREAGEVELIAATVVNRPEVPKECEHLERTGVEIFDDYERMLVQFAGQLDLVCIPTGIAWHEPMTCAALNAGAHVYLEKPAAATVAEVDRMIETRERNERQVAVGFQILHSDSFTEAKRRISEGEIGTVQEVAVKGCWPRAASYYGRKNWAGAIQDQGRKVYDSPANNALSHFLIAGLFLASTQPRSVARLESIQASPLRAKPIENFDTVSILGLTDGGVRFGFHVTHSSTTSEEPFILIRGSSGEVRWSGSQGFSFPRDIQRFGAQEGNAQLLPLAFDKTVRALRNGDELCSTLEMARRHTEIIEFLQENFPIRDVPAHLLKTRDAGESDTLIFIPGIEKAINQAFLEHRLVSDFLEV